MSLSFAQVQFALAFVTGISPERSSAFESRLKQWQKMGFPEGVNVGRGVKASYGATQVYQLLFMLKLLRVGLTPERAQRVVLTAWESIKDAIAEATACLSNRADHQHYCLIQLDALSDLKAKSSDHMHVYVELFTGDEIAEAFLEPDDLASEQEARMHQYFQVTVKNRLAVSITLEVDSMLILLWTALDASGVPADIFADEMAEWYLTRASRGRTNQDTSEHFDADFAARSIADHVTNFDVTAAARASLSKLPEHARNPKA